MLDAYYPGDRGGLALGDQNRNDPEDEDVDEDMTQKIERSAPDEPPSCVSA